VWRFYVKMGLKWFFYRKIQVLLFALVSLLVQMKRVVVNWVVELCIRHYLFAFSDHFSMAHQTIWLFNCFCEVQRLYHECSFSFQWEIEQVEAISTFFFLFKIPVFVICWLYVCYINVIVFLNYHLVLLLIALLSCPWLEIKCGIHLLIHGVLCIDPWQITCATA
jgi:hypothetical protein